MGYQELVSINVWTFIAQILNLLIQMLLFKKFLFTPVRKIIKERQEQVNGIYDSAAQAEATAQSSKQQYETMLAGAKTEAGEIVRSAATTAQTRSDEIVRQAKQEATAIKEKASRDIELERKRALNEVKDDIAGIAMDIAAKVVEKEIDEKTHKALVEEFIEKMGEDA